MTSSINCSRSEDSGIPQSPHFLSFFAQSNLWYICGVKIALFCFFIYSFTTYSQDEICPIHSHSRLNNDFESFLGEFNKKTCNSYFQRTYLAKLANIHYCKEIIASNLKSRNFNKCTLNLRPIGNVDPCQKHFNKVTKNLHELFQEIIESDINNLTEEELLRQTLDIFVLRLIALKQRAFSKGAMSGWKNNIPSLFFNFLYEGYNIDISHKKDYLVCVEQVYKFLDSPEKNVLLNLGYQLQYFDETPVDDNSGLTSHASVLVTSPTGKKYTLDPWKWQLKPFEVSDVKGLTKNYLDAKTTKKSFLWQDQ